MSRDLEWMGKFDELLIEAKKSGAKSFIVDAPTDKFTKTISSGIIEKMLNLKIVGKKTKSWKIVLTGKKPKTLKVSIVKLQ